MMDFDIEFLLFFLPEYCGLIVDEKNILYLWTGYENLSCFEQDVHVETKIQLQRGTYGA